MNGTILIKSIYYQYFDVAKAIYAYLNNKDSITENLSIEKFTEACEKYFINTHPIILSNFIENNDCKLVIIPKFVTTDILYKYQVSSGEDLRCGFDCDSKDEAEYRAVLSSIDLINEANKLGKIIKYIKQ